MFSCSGSRQILPFFLFSSDSSVNFCYALASRPAGFLLLVGSPILTAKEETKEGWWHATTRYCHSSTTHTTTAIFFFQQLLAVPNYQLHFTNYGQVRPATFYLLKYLF